MLYENQGDGSFVEIAELAGVAQENDTDTRAAAWGDIDNDGWLDLYVGNRVGPDQLYRNMGNGSFEEISFDAGIYQVGDPKSVNMADIDNDGYLDIYISNLGQENVCYLNNGNLTFTNYTYVAGALDDGLAMGTIFFDYDKDGDIDLYLVHDGYDPNFLYQNDGTGVFTEVGEAAGVNTGSFGMGVDIGDINNDGWQDIYIANLGYNFLLLNNGDGTFTNISESADIDDFGMGWGVNFLDFDKDGLIDIYVANDFAFSPYPNVLYQNMENNTFEKAEEESPICNERQSYGTARIDYNLDGNPDVVVANKGAAGGIRLYENGDRPNNWLGLKLIGVTSNQNAIGAKITIVDAMGRTHYRELTAGSSWSSQSSQIINIGLGTVGTIESALIQWPSGLEQTIDFPSLNQFYTITENGPVEEGLTYVITTSTNPTIRTNELNCKVFPNPTSGEFNLEFHSSKEGPLFIEMHNNLGQLVYTIELEWVNQGENIVSLELPEAKLSSGNYWLHIFNGVDSGEVQLSLKR